VSVAQAPSPETAPGAAPTTVADSPAAPGGKGRRLAVGAGRWSVRIASLATALLVWHLLTVNDVTMWLRFDQFPGPVEVASRFTTALQGRTFYLDLAQSLLRILTGFTLAAVLGIGLGIAIARSRWAADLFQPVLEVVRPIPAIALVPVAILLFPTNEQGIVFITCTAAFFPILVSTRHAVRALPVVWEDALRTMGASRLRVLRSVVLPGILPGVFGGLSVGMGVSWICVISAEMISGQLGVGYRTWTALALLTTRLQRRPSLLDDRRAGSLRSHDVVAVPTG
jgi:NitT/TauT family transport system permease protein